MFYVGIQSNLDIMTGETLSSFSHALAVQLLMVYQWLSVGGFTTFAQTEIIQQLLNGLSWNFVQRFIFPRE